jgi:hypothetical protein
VEGLIHSPNVINPFPYNFLFLSALLFLLFLILSKSLPNKTPSIAISKSSILGFNLWHPICASSSQFSYFSSVRYGPFLQCIQADQAYPVHNLYKLPSQKPSTDIAIAYSHGTKIVARSLSDPPFKNKALEGVGVRQEEKALPVKMEDVVMAYG